MTDLELAMIVAQRTWRGTSITEGALAVLRQVYAPHDFVGDGKECNRCGEKRSDH